MIAGDPHQGGAAWAVLQYVLGFRRLGHEVVLVEPIQRERLHPATGEFFRRVVGDFGLERSAALLLVGTRETAGLTYAELVAVGRRAEVFLNISGMLTDPEITDRIPLRVYLDLDPAFVQLWHAQGIDMRFAGHSHFVTVGQAIGHSDCPVPTCGLPWIPTLQPVVLDRWPAAEPMVADVDAPLTTVANWRGYGSIEHEGVFYGQKAHSWRPLMRLPTRTRERFLLALSIHPDERKDLAALAANGWELVDPVEAAGTPARYQAFLRGSKAELGIAKSGYVNSRCGWFSDRSVCYLASGRPVIAQETGFSRFLPTGAGLFAFETAEDVLAAIEEMNGDYPRHARAARALAEEFFDSDKVLGSLLQRLGTTS